MPVFSAGLCIRGTAKDKEAYGAINIPIRIGEIWVKPGRTSSSATVTASSSCPRSASARCSRSHGRARRRKRTPSPASTRASARVDMYGLLGEERMDKKKIAIAVFAIAFILTVIINVAR